ncbi:MAG: hypothetical protein M3315_06860 [Actinomycetota bacterium]|jgi:hypothetical protein|nr:hypothetical protein [Actinomycetota bacterium]
MKRLVLLITGALAATLIVVPTAFAQTTARGGGATAPLVPSGGVAPEIVLPAAALLIGSGILGYVVLRRR